MRHFRKKWRGCFVAVSSGLEWHLNILLSPKDKYKSKQDMHLEHTHHLILTKGSNL